VKVGRTLRPSVHFRESIQLPFELDVLAFVFPVPCEVTARSVALCSPGFTPLCCCSNVRFGMGLSAMVYYCLQSVDANSTRVFCTCAALDPPVCAFLYT